MESQGAVSEEVAPKSVAEEHNATHKSIVEDVVAKRVVTDDFDVRGVDVEYPDIRDFVVGDADVKHAIVKQGAIASTDTDLERRARPRTRWLRTAFQTMHL